MEESKFEKDDTLSSDELIKFMNEIEDEDSEYSESIKESIRKLQFQELMQDDLLPEEIMVDRAWGNTVRGERNEDGSFVRDENNRVVYNMKPVTYTDKKAEWDHAKACWDEARKRKKLELKRRKLEIQREALRSEVVGIYSKIDDKYKTFLIESLTSEYSNIMMRSEKYVNKRIEQLLKAYIPQTLKSCKTRYPEAFIENPGFMYVASKEYGEGKMLWVKPNLPYYFTQGTELQILRENEAKFLFNIDKSVLQFHYNRDMLAKREMHYAVMLKDIKTYYNLVQKNPFWYDIIINEIKRQADELF